MLEKETFQRRELAIGGVGVPIILIFEFEHVLVIFNENQ